MENWFNGRITLVGDAYYCPSLLSGKGSTLAMVGAYILAGELKQADGNYQEAFMQYETVFKPFMSVSVFSKLFLSQFKDSDLTLKEY